MPRRLLPARTALIFALTLGACLAVPGGIVRPLDDTATAEARAALGSAPVAAAAASHWLVVSLGDSVVSGGPCDCWTFPGRYRRLVVSRTGHPTAYRNVGVGGTTTRDLLAAVQPGTPTAGALRGAAVVTVTIGANDMVAARSEWWRDDCLGCFDRIGDIVRRNLTRIIRLVRADVGGTPVEILVTTYWNVFKEPRTAAAADGSWTPYDRMARRATLITNQAICAAATAGGAACIDLFRPFKGDGTRDARSLLGPDLDHPNARGHQLIATTLARHGWRGAPA